MMNTPPKLTQRAARVLTPVTLKMVNQTLEINRFGLSILDRWALNQPNKLKALEQKSRMLLLSRVLEQQMKEQEILERTESQAQIAGGLMPHEILAGHELPTSL
ncbi:MAG: hypothetical protein LBV21_06360 [Candidatus Adiutrix sp.]|jgi:hypothetical protein|nr:hypothetical protein [Candidatus Adiutrix sp.]